MSFRSFKQFFNESPEWNDNNKAIGGKSYFNGIQDFYLDTIRLYEKVKDLENNGFKFECFYSNKEKRWRVFCLDKNNVVGSLSALVVGSDKFELKIFDTFPIVRSVKVLEEYQSKKIGWTMYNLLIQEANGLISDIDLTGETGYGSFQIWEKLGKIYNSYVIDTDENKIQKVDGFSKGMMKKTGEQFMVTKDSLVLNETPEWNDTAKGLGKPNDREKYLANVVYKEVYEDPQYKKIKSVKFNNLVIELYLNKNSVADQVKVYTLFNKDVVGEIDAELYHTKKQKEPPYPMVISSKVYEDLQGHGIGTAMYDLLVDTIGGLISDAGLSGETGHGSFNIWRKLGNKYHPYLYYRFENKIVPIDGISRDLMGSSETRFMVSKEPLSLENNQ